MYALEAIDDAFEATKSFLWPFERSRWLKLAVVVFFIGAPGTNLNMFQYNVPAQPAPQQGLAALAEFGPRVWLLIGTVVAAALLLGLVFLLIGSILEFVFIEPLRREDVAIRQYWGDRWRQGVRLFGFRVLIGLIVFGSVAVFAVLFLEPVFIDAGPATGVSPGVSVLSFVLLLPVIFVLAMVIGLINGLPTVFVVPIMVLEDRGVLSGWGRLWPTIPPIRGNISPTR